ncbi:MAG: flagellar type III secretion system pore protein FliP [Gammaproteobacteria bacterium]|nr:flagellar type III secretion system pore protein FliP [Gammaproteobacteria bacterium]
MVCALAAPAGLETITVKTQGNGEQTYTLTLQALIFMTGLTLLPTFLLMMTSFTRIIVVLAILRQAIGTTQTPSNQILIGLALFLTFFIMAPVFDKIYANAAQPYMDGAMGTTEALKAGSIPLREFMLAQTRESDLALYINIGGYKSPEQASDIPFSVILPAFVTSELKTAFQIGFLLFIPFLIIDLVVASVLMSMGMMMLSPLIISLPFKIMLFVLVDGWALVLGTLANSFYINT